MAALAITKKGAERKVVDRVSKWEIETEKAVRLHSPQAVAKSE